MVTGWSYFVASSGVPASCISCTRTFPREVTRSEAWIGLPSDICGISGTVTGASHSPARPFMVAKDFCASDGAGATEDFCASDCAKAAMETNSRTADILKRRDFMFILLKEFILEPGQGYSLTSISSNELNYTVIVNYNTRDVKLFFILPAIRIGGDALVAH